MTKFVNSSLLALCLALSATPAQVRGQLDATPARQTTGAGQPHDDRAKALLARPEMRAAFAAVEREREAILSEWIAITEINAPSGKEAERAAFIERLLRGYKSVEVRRDAAGNVVATRRGTGGGPVVVIDAHMDTVFQEGLKIKAEVRGGRVYAPGVGDDTRNIEAMLATIRALDAAGVKTKGDLVFLFTVEEETNFRGVEEFVKENKGKIDHYIALDGGYEGFTYGGIGINWYKHHFVGPGGHTRSAHAALLGDAPCGARHRAHLSATAPAGRPRQSQHRHARGRRCRQRQGRRRVVHGRSALDEQRGHRRFGEEDRGHRQRGGRARAHDASGRRSSRRRPRRRYPATASLCS